jgi:hypothetical protein
LLRTSPGSTLPTTVASEILALQGMSVQQLEERISSLPSAELMDLVMKCPYGVLLVHNPPLESTVRTFLLALMIHLEALVGLAPPYSPLPSSFSARDCGAFINLLKLNRDLAPKPSLPLMAALLQPFVEALANGPSQLRREAAVAVQRSLTNLQGVGMVCPSVTLLMESVEAASLNKDPKRAFYIGPKSLRGLMMLCKTVRLTFLPGALAQSLLFCARDKSPRAEHFWQSWRSLQRCPNQNLYAALLSDLSVTGVGVGVMRELVVSMGAQLLLSQPEQAGANPPSAPPRQLSVAGHALLLRTLAGLAIDEAGVSAAEAAAHPGRSLEGYITACLPLLQLAVNGINEHFQATPQSFFQRLTDSLGSYHAFPDVDGEVKTDYGEVFKTEASERDLLYRWLRNVPMPQGGGEGIIVHKFSVDLGVLLTASALLETLRLSPSVGPLLKDVPPVHSDMLCRIDVALTKSRSAEHAHRMALLAPLMSDREKSVSRGEDEKEVVSASAFTPWMQQLVTLRLKAVMRSVQARVEGGSSASSGAQVSGVHLSGPQLASLAALGMPTFEFKVLDYSLDLCWPSAHLGLEVNGPMHFHTLSAAEMASAITEISARDGGGNGSFFDAPGLPAVVDWSVAATRQKIYRVALEQRAARAQATAGKGGLAGGGGAPSVGEGGSYGDRHFAERVRLQAIARRGWRIVHIDHDDVQSSIPLMVLFLLKGDFDDKAALTDKQKVQKRLERAHDRMQLYELSLEDLSAQQDKITAMTPHLNASFIVNATAALDSVIIKALIANIDTK